MSDDPAKTEPHKRSLTSAQAVVLVPIGAGSEKIYGVTLLREGFKLENCVFEYLAFRQDNLKTAAMRVRTLMGRHAVSDVYIMVPQPHTEEMAQFAVDLSEAISKGTSSIRVRGLKDQEVDALC